MKRQSVPRWFALFALAMALLLPLTIFWQQPIRQPINNVAPAYAEQAPSSMADHIRNAMERASLSSEQIEVETITKNPNAALTSSGNTQPAVHAMLNAAPPRYYVNSVRHSNGHSNNQTPI